jgi:hypothetical protein
MALILLLTEQVILVEMVAQVAAELLVVREELEYQEKETLEVLQPLTQMQAEAVAEVQVQQVAEAQ